MEPGAFSVSLVVKDIRASTEFYEKLGLRAFMGDLPQNWLIMKNAAHVMGLFQGVFDRSPLTILKPTYFLLKERSPRHRPTGAVYATDGSPVEVKRPSGG
jgi:hypothetical protein